MTPATSHVIVLSMKTTRTNKTADKMTARQMSDLKFAVRTYVLNAVGSERTEADVFAGMLARRADLGLSVAEMSKALDSAIDAALDDGILHAGLVAINGAKPAAGLYARAL